MLYTLLMAALVSAVFIGGVWTGLTLSRRSSQSDLQLAKAQFDSIRKDELSFQQLHDTARLVANQSSILKSLTTSLDRMDTSIGRMADILVQKGMARVVTPTDLQVGEGSGIESARTLVDSPEDDRPT